MVAGPGKNVKCLVPKNVCVHSHNKPPFGTIRHPPTMKCACLLFSNFQTKQQKVIEFKINFVFEINLK
jgi:hypothetical protein